MTPPILLFGISLSHSADLKNNFLGIKWGTDIAELTDYVKISEKNGVSYYGNSKRVYTIFGVETPYVILASIKINSLPLTLILNQSRYSTGSKNILPKSLDRPGQY